MESNANARSDVLKSQHFSFVVWGVSHPWCAPWGISISVKLRNDKISNMLNVKYMF